MRRLRVALVAVAAFSGIAGDAGAQQAQVYFNLPNDSVVAIRPGQYRDVELWGYHSLAYGFNAYSVTLLLDGSRVQVLSAASPSGLPAPTVTVLGTGDSVRIEASGQGTYYYYYQLLATVRLGLAAGAVEGSLVTIRANSLTALYLNTDVLPTHRTIPLDVCAATKTWGDLDANGQVNSRDALIALSQAVGLPITGFDGSVTDVDADGAATSRDALFILAAGIGFSGQGRTGNGVAHRCAPLLQAPADFLFYRGGTFETVIAGDSTRTVLNVGGGSVAPATTTPARWSPDGSKFLYRCGTPSTEICVANANGTGATVLPLPSSNKDDPDWSPDGTKISFQRVNELWVANADGLNPVMLLSGGVVHAVWSPDGTRLAFNGFVTCCTYGIVVVNIDGSNPTMVPGTSGTVSNLSHVAWSPLGDSLAYTETGGSINKVPVGGGTPVRVVRSANTQQWPDWVASGIAFQANVYTPSEILFQRSTDGRLFRLTRRGTGNLPNQFPDLRRTGGLYVNSVTILEGDQAVTLPGTLPFTADVRFNDNSVSSAPVTWTSLNPTVATVDAAGTVSSITAGSAQIVASVRGWRADTVTVTVNP